jgi:hypothetical protein
MTKKTPEELRAELDAINQQIAKTSRVSDRHLIVAANPDWKRKQTEAQSKRKQSGWSKKMLGNQNGKNSSRMAGKKHSEESKAKTSASMMGKDHSSITGVPKPKVTCPHCGKIGGRPQMIQYHFDKCKNK